MGLLNTIKNFFGNKTKNVTQSTNLTQYDTSLIVVPEYGKLTEKERKLVDTYIQEIDKKNLETLVHYASEMFDYANVNTHLLLKLFFKITKQPSEWQLNNMTLEKMQQERLEGMILQEELEIYKKGLKNLRRESVLRTIALQEVRKKESKRKIDFLGVFSIAERLKRRNEAEQLAMAENRMRINVKTIEQLEQVVNNTIESEGRVIISTDVYNVVLKDSQTINIQEQLLKSKAMELLEMAELVIPEEAKALGFTKETIKTFSAKNEKSSIQKIARIQRKLDIYAYMHRKDIDELRMQIEKLGKEEKTIENRDTLLEKANKLQIMYKIFTDYLQPEDLKQLYNIKFDILVTGINQQKDTPFQDIKNKQELEYYAIIIERKMENIFKGRNNEFARVFQNNQTIALKISKQLFKNMDGKYSGSYILQNHRLLSFILAFDKGNDMKEFVTAKHFDESFLNKHIHDGIYFKWDSKFSLETIAFLKTLTGEDNTFEQKIWLQLYNAYNSHNAHNSRSLVYEPDYFRLPEGILEINDKTPEWCICHNDDYDTRIYRIMKKSRKIIFPSSLKKIGSFRFRYFEAFFSSLKNVEFNEGLEEIGDFAFYRSGLEKVICPSSLKKIGQCSFYGCCNLVEVFLNDGIEKIGRTAFANNLNLHTFSVPGHKQLAQHDILCHEYYPECFVGLTDVLYSIRHPEKKDIVKNIDKSISVKIRNPSLDNLRDIIKQFSNYEYEMYYKLKNIELWNGDTKYGTYEIKSYYMTYLDVLRGLKEILKYAQREHNETEEKQK